MIIREIKSEMSPHHIRQISQYQILLCLLEMCWIKNQINTSMSMKITTLVNWQKILILLLVVPLLADDIRDKSWNLGKKSLLRQIQLLMSMMPNHNWLYCKQIMKSCEKKREEEYRVIEPDKDKCQ